MPLRQVDVTQVEGRHRRDRVGDDGILTGPAVLQRIQAIDPAEGRGTELGHTGIGDEPSHQGVSDDIGVTCTVGQLVGPPQIACWPARIRVIAASDGQRRQHPRAAAG